MSEPWQTFDVWEGKLKPGRYHDSSTGESYTVTKDDTAYEEAANKRAFPLELLLEAGARRFELDTDNDRVMISIAISLKRLADQGDRQRVTILGTKTAANTESVVALGSDQTTYEWTKAEVWKTFEKALTDKNFVSQRCGNLSIENHMVHSLCMSRAFAQELLRQYNELAQIVKSLPVYSGDHS